MGSIAIAEQAEYGDDWPSAMVPSGNNMRSPKPACSATKAAPTMPAAGPDSAVSTGVRRIARVLATPPELFISSNGAEMPC